LATVPLIVGAYGSEPQPVGVNDDCSVTVVDGSP
jgi:hypothetical protein